MMRFFGRRKKDRDDCMSNPIIQDLSAKVSDIERRVLILEGERRLLARSNRSDLPERARIPN